MSPAAEVPGCKHCDRPATRRSRMNGDYLCGDCQPCWCNWCMGRVDAHGAEARTQYQQEAEAVMAMSEQPAKPVPFAGWMPYPLVRDIRQFEHDGRTYFLGITVTAELIGEEPAGAPLPARADLARRIADLVRADCAAALAGETGPET